MFSKQKDNKKNMLVLPFARKLVSRAAFTISEVLVTLLIVGVIAAIVTPPLVRDTTDKQFVVMYKKDYSLVSAWFNTAVSENGSNVATCAGGWLEFSAYIASILRYFPDRIVKSKSPYLIFLVMVVVIFLLI